mgnify:CR=1 FL=1
MLRIPGTHVSGRGVASCCCRCAALEEDFGVVVHEGLQDLLDLPKHQMALQRDLQVPRDNHA